LSSQSLKYRCTSLHRFTMLFGKRNNRSAEVLVMPLAFIVFLAALSLSASLCSGAPSVSPITSSADISAPVDMHSTVSMADAAAPESSSEAIEAAAMLPANEPEEEQSVGGVQLDVPANIRLDRITLDTKVTKPLKYATISSLFGYRLNPVTGKYTFHSGYDLAAPSGASISAILPGKVSTAAFDKGYGNYVVIDHGGGLQTLYAHCSKLKCAAGDEVQQGEEIALVGSTGNSTGPHLHIELRKDGQRYDPEWVLGGMYD